MIRKFLWVLAAGVFLLHTRAEAAMLPYEKLYQDRQLAYLTFDDGPSAQTEKILDILDEYDIKATFFVVGAGKEAFTDAYGEIVRKGHTLALHSYSHEYGQMYADIESFCNDIRKLRDMLSGVCPDLWLYRFPGGSSNQLAERKVSRDTCIRLLGQEGLVYFDWNVDSGDGAGVNVPVDAMLSNVRATLGQNTQNVILLHDGDIHKTTVEALRQIIALCREKQMIFLPIRKTTLPVHHNF